MEEFVDDMNNNVISIEVPVVTVSIGDKDYELIPKTVANYNKLLDIEKKAKRNGKRNFEMWLEVIELLIGKQAMNEIFPSIENANVDTIENVFYGLMYAFNYNSESAERERRASKMDEMVKMTETVKPLMDVVNKYPILKGK